MNFRISRNTAIVVASLLVMTLLSGCGGSMGLSSLLKVAKVAAVVDNTLDHNKAVISIIADIVSGKSIKEVIAKVFRSGDSTPTEVVLSANMDGKFEGSFETTQSSDTTVTYTAVVEATDDAGASASSEPVVVEVPPTNP